MPDDARAVTGPSVTLERLPFGAPVAEVAAVVARDGGVILEGALTRAEVDAVNRELDVVMGPAEMAFGTTEDNYLATFMGRRTKRFQHCLKYSPTYRERLIASDAAAEYVAAVLGGEIGSQNLFASHGIEIFPGETAQELHRDSRGFINRLGLDKPGGAEIIVNMILALTDVTEEMGATRLIPRSHLWADYSDPGSQEQTIPALLNAGDVLLINGRVLHGGGANLTADRSRRVISTAWSPSFLVAEEAWPFVFTVDEVRAFSPRVQGYLGFRSRTYRGEEPGFLWRVHNTPLEEVLGLESKGTPA